MTQPIPVPRELLPECMVHRNHPGLAAWVLQSGKIVWCCEPAWSQLRDRDIAEEYKKLRLEKLKKGEIKEEPGAASLIVSLENSMIKVQHGDTKKLLYSRPAQEGDWDRLFKVLTKT